MERTWIKKVYSIRKVQETRHYYEVYGDFTSEVNPFRTTSEDGPKLEDRREFGAPQITVIEDLRTMTEVEIALYLPKNLLSFEEN